MLQNKIFLTYTIDYKLAHSTKIGHSSNTNQHNLISTSLASNNVVVSVILLFFPAPVIYEYLRFLTESLSSNYNIQDGENLVIIKLMFLQHQRK